jgi:hypothetical protein
MTIHTFLDALQHLPVSAAIRGSLPHTEWVFPIVETLHVLTLSVVFGSIAMVDVRLLFGSSLGRPVSRIAAEALPWTWVAWILSAITGSLMFASRALTYADNFQFRMKFICMGLAGVNMLVFHLGAYRQVATWDTAAKLPNPARVAGALSLLFWTAVVFFGRWVGFTT